MSQEVATESRPPKKRVEIQSNKDTNKRFKGEQESLRVEKLIQQLEGQLFLPTSIYFKQKDRGSSQSVLTLSKSLEE